jgi:hypothetical protein
MTAATGNNDPRLANGLERRAAMRLLLEGRSDLLLVTGLGSTTYDAAAVTDDDRNFYLWGAMGAAAMMPRDRPPRPPRAGRHRRR